MYLSQGGVPFQNATFSDTFFNILYKNYHYLYPLILHVSYHNQYLLLYIQLTTGICVFTLYGPKAAGREKSALRVTKQPSLQETSWPNGWSQSAICPFGFLAITMAGIRTRNFTFLEPFLRA